MCDIKAMSEQAEYSSASTTLMFTDSNRLFGTGRTITNRTHEKINDFY